MKRLQLAALAASIVALVACKPKGDAPLQIDPLAVTTEVATATTDYLNKSYVGTIEEHSMTPVSFTGIGHVTRVCVQEGQRVQKGQVIAEMDETQARNMLATAEAQMTQANDALARMKRLHDSGSLPDIKWVEVQSQVEQAKSQLAMARKNVEDCRIYAPCSGIVTTKVTEDGMTAVTAQPIVNILDISSVKVRVAIPEKEIADIRPGTRTTITVDAVGRCYQGGRIEKTITADATTHTYDILITLPNRGGELLPGMIANVSIQGVSVSRSADAMNSGTAAITLPVRSVQQAADGSHFVWVAKDGKAHRQTVTLGTTCGARIVVATGLTGGERVITEGYQKVGEGTAVKEN